MEKLRGMMYPTSGKQKTRHSEYMLMLGTGIKGIRNVVGKNGFWGVLNKNCDTHAAPVAKIASTWQRVAIIW